MAHSLIRAQQGHVVGSLRGESMSMDDADACASHLVLLVYVEGRETRPS